MGFHGRAAARKPKITMRNAKLQLEWCKVRHHWTLEQWNRIHHLAVRRTNLGLAHARRTLAALMHSANCKVWWRNNALELIFMVRARPLCSSEEKS